MKSPIMSTSENYSGRPALMLLTEDDTSSRGKSVGEIHTVRPHLPIPATR